MDKIITADSFGADIPANWEEIADELNSAIAERGIENDRDAIDELWEEYWRSHSAVIPLFDGYTKTGKRVKIDLIDDRVIITYVCSGRRVRWNNERYTTDSYGTIKLGLQNEGFNIF